MKLGFWMKNVIKLLLLALFVVALVNSQKEFAEKRTLQAQFFQLKSNLLKRQIPYSVVLPVNYDEEKQTRFPVVYILHGFSGSHKDFVAYSQLLEIYSRHKFIVVTVEGENGFYTDSQTKPNDKFESYIVKDLIPEIDSNFRTISARYARAIIGDSMGGYGALKFGLKFPEMFVLAASWSGGLTIASWRKPSEITFNVPGIKEYLLSVFGSKNNKETLAANDLFQLIKKIPTDKIDSLPFFYIDCGTEDELGLLKPNQQFAEIMVNRKIRHEFRQVPGEHTVQLYRVSDVLELSDRIFADKLKKN